MGIIFPSGEGVEAGVKRRCKLKTFSVQQNIGKVRHLVSFHDGVKTHPDRSPFFDVRTFTRKREANKLEKALVADGYVRT